MICQITEGLNLIERYGVLGLLAVVIISGLKIGWKQIEVLQGISTTMALLNKNQENTTRELRDDILTTKNDIMDAVKQNKKE